MYDSINPACPNNMKPFTYNIHYFTQSLYNISRPKIITQTYSSHLSGFFLVASYSFITHKPLCVPGQDADGVTQSYNKVQ